MIRFATICLSIVFIVALCLPSGLAKAQSETSPGPVYIVQEGDSLWDIAYRFHVSQQDLANANGISNTNQISIGSRLVIPGLEGIQGVLTAENVSYGETVNSLSLHYQIPVEMLIRLNHLTSPNQLYVGYSLVVLQQDNPTHLGKRISFGEGQSLLEASVLHNTDPWTLLKNNRLENSLGALPGDVFRVPGEGDSGPGALPLSIASVEITRLTQGQTSEMVLTGESGVSLEGSLMGHQLSFFPRQAGGYVTLQGVHAMAQPGLYPLQITGTSPDGLTFTFAQNVLVSAGDFLYDIPLSVDPATLDPEVTVPEENQWMDLSSRVSPDQLWQGEFTLPVEPVFAECYASRFGSRRSYNGSEYSYFHTGLDYCGQIGDPIYAAAAGVVVFAGPLTVRGNATMIDHGHGVFTAYMHQSELLVKPGDRVEQGQLIGKVGNTGRVEGPHLHFEVLVGGVQVNPLEWLERTFP